MSKLLIKTKVGDEYIFQNVILLSFNDVLSDFRTPDDIVMTLITSSGDRFTIKVDNILKLKWEYENEIAR